MTPNQEQIWQVDEKDKPIGPIGREDSRRTGARYRIVRISIEDGAGNILLQKRAADKKTYPGCWDTSAGGNVDYPEGYEEAAIREVGEEIGLAAPVLEEVAYFYAEAVDSKGNKMNRFTKVYRASAAKDTRFVLQKEEVSEVRWVSRDELLEIGKGGEITDGLRQTISHYYSRV
jgi:isopentenyl-diphosphate delta-isomerase